MNKSENYKADKPPIKIMVSYYDCQNKDTAIHNFEETWEKLTIHCPQCGHQEVWHDTAEEDIEIEEHYLCTNCSYSFYLLELESAMDNRQSKQRLVTLKQLTNI